MDRGRARQAAADGVGQEVAEHLKESATEAVGQVKQTATEGAATLRTTPRAAWKIHASRARTTANTPYVRPASLTTFATYAVPEQLQHLPDDGGRDGAGRDVAHAQLGGRGDSSGIDGLVDHQLGAEGLEQLDGRLGSGGPPARW